MKINQYIDSKIIEQNSESKESTKFIAVNPYFFNFLKHTDSIDECVDPLLDVTLTWSEEQKQPIISLTNLAISEDAQLFYQMYSDQMVAL